MGLKKTREQLFVIIFGTDTKAGRRFDVWLLWIILLSVAAVMLDSVKSIHAQSGDYLRWAEWTFTVFFTIEYLLRIWVAKKPVAYVFSFFGLVDLFSILPTYLSFFIVGGEALIALRALRLLRIFRILKLVRFIGEAQVIGTALKASRHKIGVFLFWVLSMVIIMGTIMYLIEGEEHGFTSIPMSIYWAIVTLTTVGYGDISPQTPLGQFLAAIIMILGYAIIAVPTGIVTAEFARTAVEGPYRQCPQCNKVDHRAEAQHCYHCGAPLPKPGERKG